MNLEALKKTIRQELPILLRLDPDFRSYIIEITRGEYAGRDETQDWFHKTLDEMRLDREKQGTKWDEQNSKWNEQNRLWREQWDAHQHQHKEEFNKLHEEIMALAKEA
jgi:hypothetical protein